MGEFKYIFSHWNLNMKSIDLMKYALGAACLCITACTGADDEPLPGSSANSAPADEDSVELVFSVPQVEAMVSDATSRAIFEGSSLPAGSYDFGVFIYNHTTDAPYFNKAIYKFSFTRQNIGGTAGSVIDMGGTIYDGSSQTKLYVKRGDVLDIYAFYPYSSSGSVTSISPPSNNKNYQTDMLMGKNVNYTIPSNANGTVTVPLSSGNLKHAMARLKIGIKRTGTNKNNWTELEFNQVVPNSCYLNLKTQTWTGSNSSGFNVSKFSTSQAFSGTNFTYMKTTDYEEFLVPAYAYDKTYIFKYKLVLKTPTGPNQSVTYVTVQGKFTGLDIQTGRKYTFQCSTSQ